MVNYIITAILADGSQFERWRGWTDSLDDLPRIVKAMRDFCQACNVTPARVLADLS